MGCDIHIYRERFAEGRWGSIDKWSDKYGDGEDVCYPDQCYEGRNYDLFGLLSKGVRREFDFSFEPRGVPLQCDPRLLRVLTGWGEDGHGHSYLYLHELRELAEFLKTATVPVEGMKDAGELAKLRESISSGAPEWSLLYPYCAYTNAPGAVRFEIGVPASFIVGECLGTILKTFDGCDGATHRVVFWFDN